MKSKDPRSKQITIGGSLWPDELVEGETIKKNKQQGSGTLTVESVVHTANVLELRHAARETTITEVMSKQAHDEYEGGKAEQFVNGKYDHLVVVMRAIIRARVIPAIREDLRRAKAGEEALPPRCVLAAEQVPVNPQAYPDALAATCRLRQIEVLETNILHANVGGRYHRGVGSAKSARFAKIESAIGPTGAGTGAGEAKLSAAEARWQRIMAKFFAKKGGIDDEDCVGVWQSTSHNKATVASAYRVIQRWWAGASRWKRGNGTDPKVFPKAADGVPREDAMLSPYDGSECRIGAIVMDLPAVMRSNVEPVAEADSVLAELDLTEGSGQWVHFLRAHVRRQFLAMVGTVVLVADAYLVQQKSLEEADRGEGGECEFHVGLLDAGVTLKSAFMNRSKGRPMTLDALSVMLDLEGGHLVSDELKSIFVRDGDRLIVCGVNKADKSVPIVITRVDGGLERTVFAGHDYREADEEIPRMATALATGVEKLHVICRCADTDVWQINQNFHEPLSKPGAGRIFYQRSGAKVKLTKADLVDPSAEVEAKLKDGKLEYYESFLEINESVEGMLKNPSLSHFDGDVNKMVGSLQVAAITAGGDTTVFISHLTLGTAVRAYATDSEAIGSLVKPSLHGVYTRDEQSYERCFKLYSVIRCKRYSSNIFS